MVTTNPAWRKSSRSSGGGDGNCVEAALIGSAPALSDSKGRHFPEGRPVLANLTRDDYSSFLRLIRR